MRHLIAAILVVLFAGASISNADDTSTNSCLDSELLNYALSQYQFEEIDKSGNVTKTYSEMDVCDQGSFRAVLLGLDYLRKIPTTKIPTAYQTVLGKEGAVSFLKNRIKTIHIEPLNTQACATGATAFVYDQESRQKIMHLCPLIVYSSPVEIASFLVHEARHIDGYPHVKCTHGILTDMDSESCDNSYQEQGSYGIGMGLQLQLYFTTNNEAVKEEARSNIILNSLNNFNKAPMGLKQGGIYLDEEGTLGFHDGDQDYSLATFTDKTVGLALHEGLPTVFFENGSVTKYDFTRQWIYGEERFIENFNRLSQSERGDIEDIFVGETVCYLFKNEIKCPDRTGFSNYQFNTIKPLAFVDRYQSWNNHLSVLAETGKVYSLPELEKLTSTRDADLKEDTKAITYANLTSFAKMDNGSVLGVSRKGTLMIKKSKSAPWTQVSEFEDLKFKKIIPYFWSKRLEDL
jgi:hypothetical protein